MNLQTKDVSSNKVIIIIDGFKFDVTEYVHIHPGGKKNLRKFNGKDATKEFNEVKGHCETSVDDLLDKFCIGKVNK